MPPSFMVVSAIKASKRQMENRRAHLVAGQALDAEVSEELFVFIIPNGVVCLYRRIPSGKCKKAIGN